MRRLGRDSVVPFWDGTGFGLVTAAPQSVGQSGGGMHMTGFGQIRKTLGVCAAGLMACGASSPAWAEAGPSRDAASFSLLDNRLEVALVGRIPGRCELGGGGDIDFGELTGGEIATAQMALDCNVPFELTLTSARGGLAHVTLPRGQGPFAGTLPYDVRVRVPTLRPEPGVLEGRFRSDNLISRQSLSSGSAIAAGGARLEIRTATPSGAGLLAGNYTETLTVTLSPRV